MISIDLDTSQNRFIIKGDLSPILNKPRAKANFRSIGAEVSQEGQLAISYKNKTDQEIKYHQLQKLLDKFNIKEISKTDAAATEIQHIDRDREHFKTFARKALSIRNNEHLLEDFKIFSETVKNRLARTLTTLQLLSAYHLAFSQNACNFSVPGAGKTTVVYAAFAFLNSLTSDNEKFIDKILVVGPLSSFMPWRIEYKECFNRRPKCRELVGISEQGRRDYFSCINKPQLTLISYPSAAASSQDIISYLKRRNDRVMVVLDEAHRIKNTEGGKWATEILSMAPYADARVILTGTPVPNGYEDLHNLFKFIWPSKKIISLYEARNITKNPDSSAGKEQLRNLIADISPFFIRVTKKDLDLPKPIENKPAIVPMDQKQAAIYEYTAHKCLL